MAVAVNATAAVPELLVGLSPASASVAATIPAVCCCCWSPHYILFMFLMCAAVYVVLIYAVH